MGLDQAGQPGEEKEQKERNRESDSQAQRLVQTVARIGARFHEARGAIGEARDRSQQ